MRMKTTVTLNNDINASLHKLIIKEITNIYGISEVSLNREAKKLTFTYQSHNAMENVRALLKKIGCPIIFDPTVL